MDDFGRLITAMVTPFNDSGNVDYTQAKKLAVSLLNSGSDGVVISGTTGEAPTLSNNEKIRLFSEVKEAVGNSGKVIAGTGSNNTSESIHLSKEAIQQGVDGLLLVVPYYNKPPQEGLFQHFKSIAENIDVPCILYNVTSRTSLNMSHETTIRLSEIHNIVGIKEAGSDSEQISRIIHGTRDSFKVWSGNDNETFKIMGLGGYGVVSVASHLVGNQIKEMIEMINNGQTSEADIENRRMLPIFNELFTVSNPIPVKYALNKIGFPVGTPRLPLIPADPNTANRIDSILNQYKIDLPV